MVMVAIVLNMFSAKSFRIGLNGENHATWPLLPNLNLRNLLPPIQICIFWIQICAHSTEFKDIHEISDPHSRITLRLESRLMTLFSFYHLLGPIAPLQSRQ